jgi:hypothetical protein
MVSGCNEAVLCPSCLGTRQQLASLEPPGFISIYIRLPQQARRIVLSAFDLVCGEINLHLFNVHRPFLSDVRKLSNGTGYCHCLLRRQNVLFHYSQTTMNLHCINSLEAYTRYNTWLPLADQSTQKEDRHMCKKTINNVITHTTSTPSIHHTCSRHILYV